MKRIFLMALAIVMVVALIIGGAVGCAPKPAVEAIVLGAPLSIAYQHSWTADRAIRLAVEEINAKGGVNVGGVMRPFTVEMMDTRDLEPGVPISEALLVVEKLILEKKADFIVGGPVRSEAALAAMDLIAKHKKVSMLSTGVLTPKYHALVAENYDKYKYLFRITGEAVWMVTGEIMPCLFDIGKRYGLNNIFIMIQDVAHARGGGGLIAKLCTKEGWTVAGPEIYPTGSTDYSVGLLKAKKAGAQVLLIWMDHPEVGILLKQWYDMQVPALPFGSIVGPGELPGFWEATEGKGAYTLANVVNAGNAPSECTPLTMKFVNAYKKRWGVGPEGYGSSSSYQVVYTLADAIERAGSIDSDAVVAALEKTDMTGVYGRIRFDPKSHQVIPSLDPAEGAVGTIFQWQEGKQVVVFPPKIATGTIKLPPWMK